MGVYTMVSVTLVCDNCGKDCCKIHTAKTDVPVYANAVITCAACIASGVEHPSGSTDKGTMEFLDQYVSEPKHPNSGEKEL